MDLKEEFNKITWISHLILGNRELCKKVKATEGYDIENVEISFKVNGVEFAVDAFEQITNEWSDRIEEEVKKKYDFLESEQAVIKKAEELIKDKLSATWDMLNNIEDNLWKLEE